MLVFLFTEVLFFPVVKSIDSLVGNRDLRGFSAVVLPALFSRTASLQLLERRLSALAVFMLDDLLDGMTFLNAIL